MAWTASPDEIVIWDFQEFTGIASFTAPGTVTITATHGSGISGSATIELTGSGDSGAGEWNY